MLSKQERHDVSNCERVPRSPTTRSLPREMHCIVIMKVNCNNRATVVQSHLDSAKKNSERNFGYFILNNLKERKRKNCYIKITNQISS